MQSIQLIREREVVMPDQSWLERYETIRHQLDATIDFARYFTEPAIGATAVDVLTLGDLHLPTGRIIACDPMTELEDAKPYMQTVPIGVYPVQACVIPSEKRGDRYACVRVRITDAQPARYECGMTGKENIDEPINPGDFYGFGVDAGVGCIADVRTRDEAVACTRQLVAAGDLEEWETPFEEALAENAKAHPKYQTEYGDWVNWAVPGTDDNVIVTTSGWGDGCYAVYFAYDESGAICGLYVPYILIEEDEESEV